MIVEVDLFSGRPNPHWQADENTAWQVAAIEAGLARVTGEPEAPPGLGYRGFVYAAPGGLHRAFGGRIDTPDAALDDPDRTVERFLLRSMPDELAAIREKVAAALP